MKLPTADNRSVTYPDRLADGVVWIELVSQAHVHGHEVLEQEIEALAAAGLLIQLGLGAPAVKLLNITDLLFTSDGSLVQPSDATPDLNLLGLLASDGDRYSAGRVLEGALAASSPAAQAHFADAPDAIAKILRFMDAIGADAQSHALHSPWIHLTVDRPNTATPEAGRAHVARRWPWLAGQALWWFGDLDADSLLFRAQSEDDGRVGDDGTGVVVPLPVSRSLAPDPGSPTVRTVRTTAGDRPVVGFSTSPTGASATAALIDATWEFIDRQGT